MLKIHELEVGKEYLRNDLKYRVLKSGHLEFYSYQKEWIPTQFKYNQVLELEFEELPFEPKIGDMYYYPMFISPHWEYAYYRDNDFDEKIKRICGIYRTQHEAVEKAKQLGWL